MKTKFNISLKSLKVEGFEFQGNVGLSCKADNDSSVIGVNVEVSKVKYEDTEVECDFTTTFEIEVSTKESLQAFNAIYKVILNPIESLMESLSDLEVQYGVDLSATKTFFKDPATAISRLINFIDTGSMEDETPVDLDIDEVTNVPEESDESADPRKIIVYINPLFTDAYDDVMSYEKKMELPSDSPAIDAIKYHAHYTLQGEGVSRVGIRFYDGSLVLVEPRSLDGGRGRRRMRRKEENNTRYHYFIGVNNGFLGDDVNQYDTIKFN